MTELKINLELLALTLFSPSLVFIETNFNVFLFARFVSKNCYLLKFVKAEDSDTLFGEHFIDFHVILNKNLTNIVQKFFSLPSTSAPQQKPI